VSRPRVLPALAIFICGALLTGCSSSTNDVCSRQAAYIQRSASQRAACDAGSTIDPNQIIIACEKGIIGCSAQDLSIIASWDSCLEALPELQCSWFVPPDLNDPDGGLVRYTAAADACTMQYQSAAASFSAACVASMSAHDGG